jgi:hypothetical protein
MGIDGGADSVGAGLLGGGEVLATGAAGIVIDEGGGMGAGGVAAGMGCRGPDKI